MSSHVHPSPDPRRRRRAITEAIMVATLLGASTSLGIAALQPGTAHATTAPTCTADTSVLTARARITKSGRIRTVLRWRTPDAYSGIRVGVRQRHAVWYDYEHDFHLDGNSRLVTGLQWDTPQLPGPYRRGKQRFVVTFTITDEHGCAVQRRARA